MKYIRARGRPITDEKTHVNPKPVFPLPVCFLHRFSLGARDTYTAYEISQGRYSVDNGTRDVFQHARSACHLAHH